MENDKQLKRSFSFRIDSRTRLQNNKTDKLNVVHQIDFYNQLFCSNKFVFQLHIISL